MTNVTKCYACDGEPVGTAERRDGDKVGHVPACKRHAWSVPTTYYTSWSPRPRFALLYGLSYPTLALAQAEARQTLLANLGTTNGTERVDITDGRHVIQTFTAASAARA